MSSLLKNSAAIQLFPLFISQTTTVPLLTPIEAVPLPALGSCLHCFLLGAAAACTVCPPALAAPCLRPPQSRILPLIVIKRGTGMNRAAVSPRPPPFLHPAADAMLPMQQRAPVSSQKPIAWFPAVTAPVGAGNTPVHHKLGTFNQAHSLLTMTPASKVLKA